MLFGCRVIPFLTYFGLFLRVFSPMPPAARNKRHQANPQQQEGSSRSEGDVLSLPDSDRDETKQSKNFSWKRLRYQDELELKKAILQVRNETLVGENYPQLCCLFVATVSMILFVFSFAVAFLLYTVL